MAVQHIKEAEFDEVVLKNKLETKKDKVMVEKLFTMMFLWTFLQNGAVRVR